ncbi:MAG: hypothetical protein DPW18_11620 [Chloroflexi bacterium]|nr:hypothetical protein [Chloroflexota bacterium]MDL1942039.1 hypothetical protein [Chloroflexi bacterium CFX2]
MNKKNLLPIVLAIGLIISIFSAARSSASPGSTSLAAATQTVPVSRITATPPLPTQTLPPSPTSATGKPLSQCASPLSNALAGRDDVPSVESYIFSEPKVVATNDFGLRIVQWISNEEVLVLRNLKPGGSRVAIEVLNIKNGQTIRLAEDNTISGDPLWLPNKRTVIYIAYDLFTNQAKNRSRLMMIGLDKQPAEVMAEEVTQPLFAMPDGEDVVTLGTGQQRLMRIGPAKVASTLSNISQLTMRSLRLLRAAQSPDSQSVVLYNDTSFVIMELKTGETTEFKLGKWQEEYRWALDVQWSPNGKYLAVRATAGRLPNPYSSLLIVDVKNECMWEVSVSRPFYTHEVAWSPGGRYLLLSGEVGITQKGYPIIEYRLLDLMTGQERKVNLWDAEVGGIYFGWSPDGKTILINCATPERGALCAIAVEVKQRSQDHLSLGLL